MPWHCDPTQVMASSFLMFLEHTQRRTTVGRTPLDEWSARRRDLYLTTHNTLNRQISTPPVGFEPPIAVGERQQTHALDRVATGTETFVYVYVWVNYNLSPSLLYHPLCSQFVVLPPSLFTSRLRCLLTVNIMLQESSKTTLIVC
jgi:hypothetical protein